MFLIDANGVACGVVNIDQALYLAFEEGLDLVEVNPNSNPPVTKIMDYGKYRYAQEKQESKQKSKSKGPELKEIRLGLKINQHDLNFKIKQAQKFLEDGNKVKLTVKLVGREMMFAGRVHDLVNNFTSRAQAEPETKIERLGNRFSTIIVRKKKEIPEDKDETKNG